MCGFTGIALRDPRERPDLAVLTSMTRCLAHRGPDDEGIESRGPHAVGFRRLSIIDLAGGHQPIFDESGDIAVVCNGEIYNFEELREGLLARGHVFRTGSDVEAIVHLYEEHGERAPEHLVGMFALCVFDWRDPARPRVLLARDRIGIKPLYWAADERGLWFASEPKAILASGRFSRRMRRPVLLDYLVTGYCSGERSAWEGIERLPPASTLSWDGRGAPKIARYWDLPREELRERADQGEVLEWLDRVVRDHLLSDVPLGAFLSGGIDSSAVVDSIARSRAAGAGTGSGAGARVLRAVEKQIECCSVGFREKAFDELETARATAARIGAVHHTEILDPDPRLAVDVLPWFFDEPLADASTVPTYLVSKMAREHVTVALSGDGGDEVFAGYRRYVFDVAENKVRRAIGSGGRRLFAIAGRHYPKLDWAPRFVRAKSTLSNLGEDPAHAYWNSVTQLSREEALSVLAPELARSLAEHDPFDAFEDHYRRPQIEDSLYRAQYADFHGFLPDQILAKSDRAAMAVSLEVRPPLLDHRFVERFVHLPAAEKVQGGRGKHALRESLRERLPASLLDGPKMGFEIPLRAWLRGPLANVASDAIESLPSEWFDRGVLRERLAEHRSGARDRSSLLWSLLVLEQWRRRHGVTGLADA